MIVMKNLSIEGNKKMELKDLIGRHMLDAVDFDSEKIRMWGDVYEDCEVMRFRLDGKVYTAIEDPEDGYRSSMSELTVSDDLMKNSFAPVEVLGRVKGSNGDDDILELLNVTTGKVIIEVGTDYSDDYYPSPSFVANFQPENI